MRRFFSMSMVGVACGLMVLAAAWPARADVLEYLWGHSGPPTLTDVAKMIDQIQRSLVNQGTVVIKQPDVWSQARMTQFRQEYEDTMAAQLTKFELRLAGRIARSDAASYNSQTALAASISPLKSGQNLQLDAAGVATERGAAVAMLSGGEGGLALPGNPNFPEKNPTSTFALLNGIAPVAGTKPGEQVAAVLPLSLEPNVQLDQQSDYINHLHRLRRINLGDDNADSAGYGLYLMRVPLSIQPGDHTKKGFGAIANLTVRHDFNPGFLQGTYRNLVINDLVDKLSPVVHELIRSGIAKQYEEGKNHFDADPETEAKLLEKYEGIVSRTDGASFVLNRSGTRRNAIAPSDLARVFQVGNLLHLAVETQQAIGVFPQPREALVAQAILADERPIRETPAEQLVRQSEYRKVAAQKLESGIDQLENINLQPLTALDLEPNNALVRDMQRSMNAIRDDLAQGDPRAGIGSEEAAQALSQMKLRIDIIANDLAARAATSLTDPNTRETANQSVNYMRSARELIDEALKALAQARMAEAEAQEEFERKYGPFIKKIRLTDVRSYLRNQLEAAYDIVDGHCKQESPVLCDVDYVEMLVENFYCREFEGPKFKNMSFKDKNNEATTVVRRVPPNSSFEENEFAALYEAFVDRLPGNLHDRGLGTLAWGIALEAGLLNRHLREDMKETKGNNDYAAPPDVDLMCFYVPNPPPEIERAFEDYVRARWPMIVFALEPVVDQQNIEDAFTRRRDLQLAVAFALASGRIGFRQAMTYTRNLQYEAQTIALNQTVSAFANGNDTFGWRITPRYQTPPEESNLGALTNTILRGGPSPNRQLNYAKIEPGMRELTAVIVMPSFVRGVRVDTWSDWFRLTDPESRKLHTARTVEIGRRINEARDSLELACKHGNYRPEDVERLRVRLHQLESMLPIQTAFVRVPYENTLGGFALFSQGKTDLVPMLDGYDGLDYINPNQPTDLIIHGRNFSLYETSVIVGGKNLIREGARSFVARDAQGNAVVVSSTTNPVRDDKGNLVLQGMGADGKSTTVVIPDPGSYLIQSREVMRLRVPKGVATVKRADGSEAVEVNVSTPTGISNRLLIPVEPKPAAKTPAPTATTLPTSATIVDPVVNIQYEAKVKADGTIDRGNRRGVPSGRIVRILPANTSNLDKFADVSFEFLVPAPPKATVLKAITIKDVELDLANKCYFLSEKQIDELASQIEVLLQGAKPSPGPESATFTTRGVTLSIPAMSIANSVTPPRKPHQVRTTNQLTINYEFVVVQIDGAPSAAIAAREPASTPRRDAQALRASAQEPVIPPPVPPLDLGGLPALPEPDQNAGDAAENPTDAGLDAPTPEAPPERPVERDVSQGADDEPASETPPTVIPAAVPPPTTPTPAPDNRGATVVVPASGASQMVVVAPQPPTVNVAVPITNVAKPPHRGLFRREPATPQNPARRSLLQRAINGP